MAENESRVHKASEVRKRRAPEKVRPEAQPAEKPQSAEKSNPRPKPHTRPQFLSSAEPTVKPAPTSASEPGPASAEDKPRKQRNKKLWIAVGIAAFVAVALAVTAAALAWNRWARYDDAADMQGIWYAYGTEVPVTFTQDSIIFDENTAYTYEIDAEAKTIRYSIGDMEGQGRYWFDDDRDVLIVTDGDDFTKWGTVLDDASRWLHDLFNGASLPMTADSIAFSRIAMTDGFVTVAPEEGADEAADAEAGEEHEGQGAEEQPADDSGDDPPGEAAGETADGKAEEPTGKEAMKGLPISDIIEEDDTPEWGKKTAGNSEAEGNNERSDRN